MHHGPAPPAFPPLSALWNPTLLDRRDLLRVGSLSLASTLLPGVGQEAQAAFEPSPEARAKSVIFLWMGGGVTHIDSFDPKPEAPEEIRGELSAIDTALPGVQFGECMPHLAEIADQLAVVRSFAHGNNSHLPMQVYTLSGRKVGRNELFKHPNLGSIVSYLYGPRNGLPGYIAVPGVTRPANKDLFVGGWLGNQYAPFAVGGVDLPDYRKKEKEANPSPHIEEDLTPKALEFQPELSRQRISRRANLRQSLDRTVAEAERQGALSALEGQYRSALDLLVSPDVRQAFDIDREPEAVREKYGRTKIGGRCLLARRLVEAGARWIMVDYGYDPDYGNLWDNHCAPVQKQPHISKMCKRGYHLVGIDRAFAGLISDLQERGLLENTLVVFLTEFGRTPKINKRGGRDHWGAAGSIFFTGAGTRVGQVVGATDKRAAYPIAQTYDPADVAATIFHAMGIPPETRVPDRQSRPIPVLDHGRPIEEVVG